MRATSWQKRIKILSLIMSLIKYSLLAAIGSILVKDKRAYVSRIIHLWARDMLHILRVQYKVFNSTVFEFDSGRPYIIMSNHASHFDIPLICVTFPREVIGMIAKRELFNIPFFGRSMRLGGCVSIDRENKYRAIKDLEAAEKNMLTGVRFWIAPEGTRSRTGKMGAFKKGGFKIALDVKAIIVPIAIIGSDKVLPPKTFDIGIGEKVEIHIGKPIDVANYQRQDLEKLMVDVANEVMSEGRATRCYE
jgi:1-acyl-sn-glycerol-3-phosphate acyltransferase